MSSTIAIVISEHSSTCYKFSHAHLPVYAASKGDISLLFLVVLTLHTLIQWVIVIVFVTVSSS